MERPIAIAAVLMMAAPAIAGPGEDHFERGQRAEDAGEHAVASAEYIAAYGELEDPRLFYYIGHAFEQEGNKSTAVIYYKRYLREVEVPEEHRAEVTAKIERLSLAPPKPALMTRTEIAPAPARIAPPGFTAPEPPEFLPPVDRPVRSRPGISGGRLVGEFFLGGALSIVGGIGGLVATDESEEGTQISAGLGGYAMGAATGVYAVGAAGDETGSFGATFLGSAIGTGAGLALLTSGEEDTLLLAMALPTIGAMIGFNLTRKSEKPSKGPKPFVIPNDGGFSAGLGGSF